MPRILALLLAASLVSAALAACAPAASGSHEIVHVPAEASTLAAAMNLVAPGGEILIAAGHYEEQLLVNKPDVTIRGADRNRTVIDGGGIRPYGVVAIADGVSIENLTVTGTTFYGVLVTGLHDKNGPTNPGAGGYTDWDPASHPPLKRFLVDHVTAYNNGLYGVYAFNSHDGEIRDSYASGSADSGFYVGQCEHCGILVSGNVAERNAVGFENANASDSVVVVDNRFSGNRVGMTFLSSYQEAFTPQHGNVVAGNLVSNNTESDSPSQAEGGFATGIGISGGQGNTFTANRISGNPRAGVILTNTEDIPATGNHFVNNVFDTGVAIANVSASRAPAHGNCWDGQGRSAPDALIDQLIAGCTADGVPEIATSGIVDPAAPPGVSFRRVKTPPAQPNIRGSRSRSRLPAAVTMPSIVGIAVPGLDLFTDRAGTK